MTNEFLKQIEKNNNTIKVLKERIDELKNQIDSYKDSIENLQNQNDDLQKQIDEFYLLNENEKESLVGIILQNEKPCFTNKISNYKSYIEYEKFTLNKKGFICLENNKLFVYIKERTYKKENKIESSMALYTINKLNNTLKVYKLNSVNDDEFDL